MDYSEYSIVSPKSSVKSAKYDTVTNIRDLIAVPLASSTLIMDDFRYRQYTDLPSEISYQRQSDGSSVGSSENGTLDDVKSEPSNLNERNKSLTFTIDDKPKDNWRFKLTIPEPFNMCLRDANRSSIKAKLHQQLQQEIDRKIREDAEECCHQFRANPVPPQTYLPVYETMTIKEKLRKIHRHDKSHERVLKVQKPFDFYYREEVKKYFRSSSAPDLSRPTETSRTFQAKPVPAYIERRSRSAGRVNRKPADTTFDKSPSTTIPLKQPKVFNSNNICPKLKKVRDLETEANWIKNNLRPSLILNPPDFKTIHKKLAKKQAQSQMIVKHTTSCEPFHLLTSNLPHRKERKGDTKREKDSCRDSRWPFTPQSRPIRPVSSSSVCQYSPSTPKLNWAAKLRVDKNKSSPNVSQGDRHIPRQDIWRNSVRRSLRSKMSDYVSETIEEKLKRRKYEIKSQLLQYQQEISDMITRVECRPLLMEQQVEMAARRRAERQFVEKLRKQGLTEEFILEKSLHARDSGFAQSSRSVSRSNSSTRSSKPSRYIDKASSSEDLSHPTGPASHSTSKRVSLESNGSQGSADSASSSEVGEM